MKEEKLIKKIEDSANKFKLRAHKGPGDRKRHDRVRRDEQESMWITHQKLDWSFVKIGSVFGRDWRTIKRAIETYKPNKRQMAALAGIQDPLIIEARSKHFNKICSWLERWKEQLLTIPDFFQTEDVLPKDSKYRKGSIRWQHREDGRTYVWFEIENDQVIFNSLRIHLDNEKLWRRFDELRHRLTEDITQAGQAKPGTKVDTRAARFQANQIANELEMPILKGIFPGKCPVCPDY